MRKYKGIRVRQREHSTIEFILFAAPAREVYAWSQADDIRLDKGNVQRELIDSRWRQVKKFFAVSPNNIIPTSITVAFDQDSVALANAEADLAEGVSAYFVSELEDNFVEIAFPDAVKESSFIIDGQHRLKGISEVPEQIVVPICLFPALSRLERAFQFVTINNKSHKVPTDNLKALIRNFENIEEGLRVRLSEASITAPRFATHVDVMNEDPESPFHKLIDWVNNRHVDGIRLVAPAAIENSLKAITAGFPATREEPADAIVVMSAIWRRIFAFYGVTIANIETFPNLHKKAVIQRVTEMVVEFLVKMLDPAFSTGHITSDNAKQAGDAAERLVYNIPPEFWKEEWARKGLDTGVGRDVIALGIRQLKALIDKHPEATDIDWRAGNPLFVVEMGD